MSNKFLFYVLALGLAMVFTSCGEDDEDPMIPNEEEVITTLNYTLTPADPSFPVVELTFVDLDGDGPNAATITGGTLIAGITYAGSIELLNEQESPAEDITAEIAEEDADHQFFFDHTLNNFSVTYNDQDGDGNPVGLATIMRADADASGDDGELTVILRHEPNKSAAGVSNGDIANAGGSTDIEVTFPIEID